MSVVGLHPRSIPTHSGHLNQRGVLNGFDGDLLSQEACEMVHVQPGFTGQVSVIYRRPKFLPFAKKAHQVLTLFSRIWLIQYKIFFG